MFSQELLDAIQNDEFGKTFLLNVRKKLYASHRDWTVTTDTGQLVFDDSEWALLYGAMCTLLGLEADDTPDLGNLRVHVGNGQMLPAAAVEELRKQFVPKDEADKPLDERKPTA